VVIDKMLPYILFEKYVNILALEMASPREPALCQWYRHTFVPYCQCLTTYTLKSSIALCNWAECVTVIGHNVTTKFQCISVVHWMPFGIRILTACFEWHSAYFKMTLLAVNCPCTDVKKLSGGVLAWLSVWTICRLACGPADATATHCLLLQ